MAPIARSTSAAFVLVVALIANTTIMAAAQPYKVWNYTNQHDEFELYYVNYSTFDDIPANWFQANAQCQGGGDQDPIHPTRFLAQVRNYDQFYFLGGIVPIGLPLNAMTIAGGTDTAKHGYWRWGGYDEKGPSGKKKTSGRSSLHAEGGEATTAAAGKKLVQAEENGAATITGGRWSGWLFAKGKEMKGDFGVEWYEGQPIQSTGMNYLKFDTVYLATFANNEPSYAQELYYLCVRQQCNAVDDCYARGELDVRSEYYPYCTCGYCKEGFSGKNCEIYETPSPKEVIAPYNKTWYILQYSPEPVSYDTATALCVAVDVGTDAAFGGEEKGAGGSSSGGNGAGYSTSWSIAVLDGREIIDTLNTVRLRSGAWVGQGSGGYKAPSGYGVLMEPDGSIVVYEGSWEAEIHYYYCSRSATINPAA